MPPKANSSIASTCAVRDGSPQGNLANQASNPCPPRARAPLSREATTLKNVSRLGKKTANVRKACTSFQPCPIPGVCKLVVQAHRRGQEQKKDERTACHGVAKQLSPRLPWYQGVPGDVRREQPEIDNRMSREPEQGTCQEGVGPTLPPQRPRDEHQQHFGRQSQRRDAPHRKGDQC